MDFSFTKEEKKAGKQKRLDRIAEAIGWPQGTQERRLKKVIWSNADGYAVSLSKPGKEAAYGYMRCRYKDGHSGNNPNDMLPLVSFKRRISENASFSDIFRELFLVRDMVAGELFGALLYRSAFMLDHRKDTDGNWRYVPNPEAIREISKTIKTLYQVSIEAFLHYLDALAWNEDVKYHTLGYDVMQGYGRVNSLLTCAHIVAVAAGRVEFYALAGGFSRPPIGVSAISQTAALEAFPTLILPGPPPVKKVLRSKKISAA